MTAFESQEIDKFCIENLKIPSEKLMEEAGRFVAEEVEQELIQNKKSEQNDSILILCGPGNNGGDAFVAARFLIKKSYRVNILVIASNKEAHSQWAIQKEKLQTLLFDFHSKGEIIFLEDLLALNNNNDDADDINHIVNPEPNLSHNTKDDYLFKLIKKSTLIIDGIWGTGFNKTVPQPIQKLFHLINHNKKTVFSIDIPSGLHPDTGCILGAALKAKKTLTFGLPKVGFFLMDGPEFCGEILVHPLLYPKKLIHQIASNCFGFDQKIARKLLPIKKGNTHKGNNGHVIVIGGSCFYKGAGILSASAACRIGAGYVTLSSHNDIYQNWIESPEFLVQRIDEISWKHLKKQSVFALGPGLGVSKKTAQIILRLKKINHSKVILDADAINTCVEYNLWPLPAAWILTPHPGELSKILNVDSSIINQDRLFYATQGVEKCGCHLLLKGHQSVFVSSSRIKNKTEKIIILSGNAALAKAGTGDVLTGFIAGLLAQKVNPAYASCLGAFIHGQLATNWIQSKKDLVSLMPSDLKEELPSLLFKLRKGKALKNQNEVHFIKK